MSVVQEERNELRKRFGDKAVILIEDTLYSVELLTPTDRNHRLVRPHPEAVERLNGTMQRHIDGNAQIYVTMLYKDVPREQLVVKWWQCLKETETFKRMPERLRALELEQVRKIGPTSRFKIEKLYDGFVSHIDTESSAENRNLKEYSEAAIYFTQYIVECIRLAQARFPEEWSKFIAQYGKAEAKLSDLPKDKTGGDPFFIRVDRKIGGVVANELYYKLQSTAKHGLPYAGLYYEMFIRVQNKGNNLIGEKGEILESNEAWKDEKNRVVQGDSRTWQFMLKPMSTLITQFPKMVSTVFAGWADQLRKNEIIKNSMSKYRGSFLFDSFDAEEYDASTDSRNFSLGIKIMYDVWSKVMGKQYPIPLREIIEHYLHDPTLTPWGAFERDSTPSGHNFTGPNGTVTNLLRAYTQTKRLLKVTYSELNNILHKNDDAMIAMFMAVGDDAWQLRDLSTTAEDIAAENNLDGYKNNPDKIVLDPDFIHFLQFGYYTDSHDSYIGYYPVSRVMEHALFQEHAAQYNSMEVSTQAVVQNLNNARFNPNLPTAVEFLMHGDEKYRLGAKGGVLNLFKAAANGRKVAEFLGREWDPQYQTMSWKEYEGVLQPIVALVESTGRKLGYT